MNKIITSLVLAATIVTSCAGDVMTVLVAEAQLKSLPAVTAARMEVIESKLLSMMATNTNPAELRDLAAALREIKISRAVDIEARLAGLVERAVKIAPTAIRILAKQEETNLTPLGRWCAEAGAVFLEGDEGLPVMMAKLPAAIKAEEEARKKYWADQAAAAEAARKKEKR